LPKTHIVKAGECISSIAIENGFTPSSLWNNAANTSLRDLRKNGNVLAPGDEVTIPDKKLRTETGATGQLHSFKRKGVPEKLVLVLKDFDEPRADLEYKIDIDGRLESGKTDADGKLEHFVPVNASKIKLLIGDGEEEYELRAQGLPPVETEKGVRSRLVNLGFIVDPEYSSDELQNAVREFQASTEGLDATGDVDDDTREKLVEAHGS
jgi:N-acetylmuramoyl-L-alanine amidase